MDPYLAAPERHDPLAKLKQKLRAAGIALLPPKRRPPVKRSATDERFIDRGFGPGVPVPRLF